ncbi:hypothetical protein [Streptomyces morookaense]|uniref:Transposase n=1 Tax=Streptomyces morookaense TaxID=1970 RepID=A0A7Y7B6S9_STRMO|nr:hypothetical protein [Streptomyces morookaense]NVK80075.1 hypothetical protein [Streptomyces morookaense]GHF46166.1 hypothetical protein GCM10010359_55790 [Streptomyces morookaense]
MLGLIDAELAGRPGPEGLPVRTVLVGLLLSLHYHQSATLADACRVLLDELRPTARGWLGVAEGDRRDSHFRIAFSRRVYRALDRLTSALDPHRCDRRRHLPADEAAEHAAAWEDEDAEHLRRRQLLQEISDRLVLVTVRLARKRGLFKGWKGDIGIDTTPVPAWHDEPQTHKGLASIEITAGWHYCAGSTEGIFGHSATLLVAGSRRHPAGHPRAGHRITEHPQLALGLVLDSPGKRLGPNAIHALGALAPFGFPAGVLAVDRAYTDQTTPHFAEPARRLGYRLVLDYKRAQRGVQGSAPSGALLVDGSLACPAMPTRFAHATTGLDDGAVRDMDAQLAELIAQRQPFFLKTKQAADARGTIRLQCPAAGPSPSVNCPRFQYVHGTASAQPKTVDLTNIRATSAHTAAKPTVPIPTAERLRPPPEDELPRICRKPTITLHPGGLGPHDKFRQDFHYLGPAWHDAYKPIRANNEGLNGRAKSHRVDIGNPRKRLAHGRVAQTILVALMICTLNLQILHDWHLTTGTTPTPETASSDPGNGNPAMTTAPANTGIPPP